MNLLAAAVFLIASAAATATAELTHSDSDVNKAAAAVMNANLVGEKSSSEEVVVVDDDYDELVRQVLEENPPEEQGIRPEWEDRVGWNRKEKEDIYDTSNADAFFLDDYDELVRQVIEENPPEEQGIRPEWEERVGWHRKEDIHNIPSSIEGPAGKRLENDDLPEAQPASNIMGYLTPTSLFILTSPYYACHNHNYKFCQQCGGKPICYSSSAGPICDTL